VTGPSEPDAHRTKRHGERIVYDSEWVRLSLVDIEPPDGRRFEHHVVAASEEDRWSMAECLTANFRGDDGTVEDTHEFNRLLGLLAG